MLALDCGGHRGGINGEGGINIGLGWKAMNLLLGHPENAEHVSHGRVALTASSNQAATIFDDLTQVSGQQTSVERCGLRSVGSRLMGSRPMGLNPHF